MTTVSNFLKSIDSQLFESILESFAGTIEGELSAQAIDQIVESADIASFKKTGLREYLDANKDKLLARVEFKENDPVRISDDFAPRAGQHGVVMARGTGGVVQVKFDDCCLDMDEKHLIHATAPVEKEDEVKGLALSEDGNLTEIIMPAEGCDNKLVSEQLEKNVLAIFPSVITEELDVYFTKLADLELTPAQSKLREEIFFAANSRIEQIQEQYGDKWTEVLYAVATMNSISEELTEDVDDAATGSKEENEEAGESAGNSEIFNDTNPEGDKITITKSANGFLVNVVDKNNDSVESKSFATAEEAEKLAQTFM